MSNFNEKTYEYLLNLALSTVPNNVDKRQGSIIYDALAPACYLLAFVYQTLTEFENSVYADTATGEALTRRCAERNVIRNPATYAKRLAQFDIDVPIGTRYSINGVTYKVDENLPSFQSYLICEQSGNIGNIYFGDLLTITSGVDTTVAELMDIVVAGEDEETDDELRARYYKDLKAVAFGGNRAAYREFVKALDNVGACQVFSQPEGPGTVDVFILDSGFNPASSELIEVVQNAVDPWDGGGNGYGIAPIGHSVWVRTPEALLINVATQVTLQSGYVWADVLPGITSAISAYLLDVRKSWDEFDNNSTVVRISQLEIAIMSVIGVIDVAGTTLNGLVSNLVIEHDKIPMIGTVTQI